MKVGDKIIVVTNYDTPAIPRRGTITKVSTRGLFWIDRHHAPEDCIYDFSCWPEEVEDSLMNALRKCAELKKAYDDSISLIYELRNECKRKETGNEPS